MAIIQNVKHQFNAAGLTRGARKDPELYGMMGIMLGLGAMVGWVIPRMLTSSTSENTRIAIVPGTAPYENGDHKGGYKFKYVPMGSDGQVREGPAALNAVIVPDMNLPRHLHERFNKFGKEDFGV